MTYAQWDALLDAHNATLNRGRRHPVEDASHSDIAALKHLKIASG